MSRFDGSSHRTPIYRDAGFLFPSIAEAEQAFCDENNSPQSSANFIYTRYGNPTVRAAEVALSRMEGSAWSLLTSSGMSAIDTALSIFQDTGETGTWLFLSELYGGTNAFIDNVLIKRRGIDVKRFYPQNDVYDLAEFSKCVAMHHPKLVFIESISNPLLIVPPAVDMIRIVKGDNSQIRVVVDNTFGTPLLWKPLDYGADMVVHSATKYLGGHGNITAGVLCGNDEKLMRDALEYRKFVGCILSPDDAYRLETQLETLELRFTRQCSNASTIANLLSQSQVVKRTLYPGLTSHPTFSQAESLIGAKGYGAMVTFELDGGRKSCDDFVASVHESIPYVPTLGDTTSILLHVSTVFTAGGYPEGMIRLSVGCEREDRLKAVLKDGLQSLES